MTDARNNERSRVLLHGNIVFNSHLSRIKCTIRNMSPTGAKIDVSKEHPFPNEFLLEIPAKKQSILVRLVWRNAESAGVQFMEQDTIEMADRSGQDGLERENRRLKSTLTILMKQLADLGQDPSFVLGDRQL